VTTDDVGHTAHPIEPIKGVPRPPGPELYRSELLEAMQPPDLLAVLVKQCVEDSKSWYPEMHSEFDYPELAKLRLLIHHVLALCGESGELANIVKKIDRGSIDFHDTQVRFKLQDEIVDVLVYLLCLAGILEFDLLKAYHVKREFNINRFGPGGTS
jgi:NTP pyrophosphatase (non-canonical NTP hydrolase)